MVPGRSSARRIRAGALGAGLFVAAATLLAFFAPRAAWLLANTIVLGIPCWIGLVAARELLRIAVARCFGFRLFALRWGLGPIRLRGRLGRMAYGLTPAPFAIESHLASSRPRHHRAARWSFQLAPLVGQSILAATTMRDFDGSLAQTGFAPAETLAATNVILLLLHGLLALDSRWGLRTDLRRLIELALAGHEEDRVARAEVWVIAIEDALEAGDPKAARARLGRALASLGREADLVTLERRLDRIESAPDPSAAARAESRHDPLAKVEANAQRPSDPVGRRVLAGALGLAPLLALGFVALISQREPVAEILMARWSSGAVELARQGDAASCEAALRGFEKSMGRLDRWTPPTRSRKVLGGFAQAELSACSGDLERAILHQREALAETDAIRAEANAGEARIDDPLSEIDAVSRQAAALRRLAGWETSHAAYREALQSVGRASEEIMLAANRTAAWPESPERARAQERLALEDAEILLEKTRIFRVMGAKDRAQESYETLLSSWSPGPDADPEFTARMLAAAPN